MIKPFLIGILLCELNSSLEGILKDKTFSAELTNADFALDVIVFLETNRDIFRRSMDSIEGVRIVEMSF